MTHNSCSDAREREIASIFQVNSIITFLLYNRGFEELIKEPENEKFRWLRQQSENKRPSYRGTDR